MSACDARNTHRTQMYRQLLTKRPWLRIKPDGYLGQADAASSEFTLREDWNSYAVSQSDFLRELHPSGHRIHSTSFYPNIYRVAEIVKTDADGNEYTTKRYYEEQVPRIAFAWQPLIALKHAIHLCGNDVQFDATKADCSDEEKKDIAIFRNGWLDKDMEVAFFRLVRSVKRIADGAIVGYMTNGIFEWQLLSFENGDRLFPKYSNSGKLELFARQFVDYDEEGMQVRMLEVWDDHYLTRLKSATVSDSSELKDPEPVVFLGKYELQGYVEIDHAPHGFDRIPVAYKRDDNGPAHTPAQDLIEEYEVSFSQMAQNNKVFGEPILVFKGEDIDCVPDDLTGSIKTISMDSESDVKYLEGQSASESYMKQLETLYKMIFETTSTVIPPKELKSGDLPAAALKILYSPAYEQAIEDTNLFSDVLGDLVEIFKTGYGIEIGKLTAFKSMPLKFWLKPYVHINWSAVITDLVAAVGSGFLSKQTASERASEYTTPDEWTRIQNETEEAAAKELEKQILLEKEKSKNSAKTQQQATNTTTTNTTTNN